MSARSLNLVQLIGNLTRDPELRYTPKGAAVCDFGVATNRSWVTAEGGAQEESEFHNVVAWGKLAELCNKNNIPVAVISKGFQPRMALGFQFGALMKILVRY